MVSGSGSTPAFLGSAAGLNATGTATAYYADGSTPTGSFGFPNWSFQPPEATVRRRWPPPTAATGRTAAAPGRAAPRGPW
ncbi:MAG: hypothetical protein ACRDQB_08770, partial [Thermocrispum sp.]